MHESTLKIPHNSTVIKQIINSLNRLRKKKKKKKKEHPHNL
jgi:hypothetical protein